MDRFAIKYPDVIAGLQARYGEPHRAYHTWAHIEALLTDFQRLNWAAPLAVEAALFFHDAVYQPLTTDNEAASAALMRGVLQGRLERDALDHAEAIVLATARHTVPEGLSDALAGDIRQFLDMDLAILGAPPDVFDAYDVAIRREFAEVPDAVFYPRRRAVMAGFLARPRIYLTDAFHRTHDAPARANLARLVARLPAS